MKLCVDCKYFVMGYRFLFIKAPRFGMCGHPSVVDAVTGEPVRSCVTLRADYNECKNSGELWEPRKP